MNAASAADMIKKMKASIEHQANTNSATILEQAKQDSERLRNRTVYAARLKIKEEGKLKKKQIKARKSVQLSIVNGGQRMRVLKMRDDAVQKSVQIATKKLEEIAKSPEYKNLLYKICLQGLISILESKVELAVKAADAPLIKGMIDHLKAGYERKTSKSVDVKLSDYVVPDRCIGGVVLIAQDGRIQCSNTLLDRLALATEDLYPQIRQIFLTTSTK